MINVLVLELKIIDEDSPLTMKKSPIVRLKQILNSHAIGAIKNVMIGV